MLPDGTRIVLHDLARVFPWVLNLYYGDPVQYLTTAGEVLHDLDDDLSVDDLSDTRCVYVPSLSGKSLDPFGF